MPKSAQGSFPSWQGEAYNRGYGDGYARNQADPGEVAITEYVSIYMRAYIAGFEGRLEDEESIAYGEFDLLSEEERKAVYGDEHDRV